MTQKMSLTLRDCNPFDMYLVTDIKTQKSMRDQTVKCCQYLTLRELAEKGLLG